MVCKHIAHFGNSETFPRSYDSKLWAQYLQLNTTTFMFIDLSKTVFFFLSSLTVHLPAYCHSISVCLVITWEICVPVSTVLLIRFRLGIAGSLAMKGRIWGMWPMQVSLDAVLLKKTKKTLLTLKVVMLCTGCVLIDWKICLNKQWIDSRVHHEGEKVWKESKVKNKEVQMVVGVNCSGGFEHLVSLYVFTSVIKRNTQNKQKVASSSCIFDITIDDNTLMQHADTSLQSSV